MLQRAVAVIRAELALSLALVLQPGEGYNDFSTNLLKILLLNFNCDDKNELQSHLLRQVSFHFIYVQ